MLDLREANVKCEIIEPMQRLFLPPRSMGEAEQLAALREYVSALRFFTQDVLHAAWLAVRDSYTGRSWPAVALFVQACRNARKVQELPAARAFDPDEWQRGFDRFCEHRGLSASARAVLLRPNMWWLRPRSEWCEGWHEHEIPQAYR